MTAAPMDGRVFGSLSVVAFSHRTEGRSRHYMWRCRCVCGTETVVDGGHLKCGHTTSCGCMTPTLIGAKHRRHGEAGHNGRGPSVEFTAWQTMLSRCGSPANKSFANYGGRGIRVCERWRNGENGVGAFECFLADMGRRPAGRSLDRIDVNGNYQSGNCRWATAKEQARNQRRSILVDLGAGAIPLKDACEKRGLDYHKIWQRLNRCGWSVNRALELGGRSDG